MLESFLPTRLYTLLLFNKWDDVLREKQPLAEFTFATGMWHYAQGLAQAGLGRTSEAETHQRQLAEIVAHPCVPMPGAIQAKQQEVEATVEFRQARQRHPGIESAINALQTGNGLARCRDRSERGFSRYIQLAVLGRNLHVLGKILLAREDAHCEAAESRRKHKAA